MINQVNQNKTYIYPGVNISKNIREQNHPKQTSFGLSPYTSKQAETLIKEYHIAPKDVAILNEDAASRSALVNSAKSTIAVFQDRLNNVAGWDNNLRADLQGKIDFWIKRATALIG